MARRTRRASSPSPSRSAPAPSRPAPRPAPSTRSSMPARAAPRQQAASSVPAHAPTQGGVPMQQQPRQPGLMGQMAATAGGVAIGSAVGHTIGHAMTGAFSGGDKGEPAEAAPQGQQYAAPQQQYDQQQTPCQYEMEQFMRCAQTNAADLSMCQVFNDQLRQCKLNYGLE